MKAIIPVAGEGTRLRPHTYTLPKVMVQVAGKPILGHIIEQLMEDGIDELVLIVGYRGDQIREYVSEAFDLKIHVIPQEKRLGLGHAIYLAKDYMDESPSLIVLGDTIFDCSFKGVFSGGKTSIGVREVEDPRRFGVVKLENELIKEFVEKPDVPPSNLAIVGLYFIQNSKKLADALETLIVEQDKTTKGEYQLTDALQIMLEEGEEMTTFPVTNWFDCGKPETVLATNRSLLQKKSKSVVAPGCIIREPVYIAENVKLVDSILGPNASIAEGSVIEESIVQDSIVNRNSTVKGALLRGSLLGENSLVEGTFQSLNLGDSAQILFGKDISDL
ncbi:MAG: NTP transferase domain-containing protein [Candidatus Omnitrophica bacterium]|nr:NTP transferase domain-containing protein [Candidatus Omnitrophota bacterium]